MVQLKLVAKGIAEMRKSFQFHNGTIKTSFESVRNAAFALFQFHNGTIKTSDFNEDTSLCYVFQFHNGTIKTS